MLPNIWGKYGWDFWHLVTLGYPEKPTEENKRQYRQYFYSLQYVLPCTKCCRNMTYHLKKYPLTDEVLSNRTNLVKWGIDFHNVVNYYTGKRMLTYSEALNDIHKLVSPVKTISYKTILYCLLLVIILLVIAYFIYRNVTGRHNEMHYEVCSSDEVPSVNPAGVIYTGVIK